MRRITWPVAWSETMIARVARLCAVRLRFLLVYLAMFAAVRLDGYRMVIPEHYYQLLSLDVLRSRFWQSILYLHMQPPLLNTGLGFALMIANGLGIRPESVLMTVNFVLGGIAACALGWLCEKMIPNRWAAALCFLLLIGHPGVYLTQHHYFYTFHEWVLLIALGAAALAHLEKPSVGRFAAVCVLMTLLVYTRSLFHFVWGLTMLVLIAQWGRTALRGPAGPSHRRDLGTVACLVITTMVLLAWPLKNYCLFGRFTYTTWTGFNLLQGLDESSRPAAPPVTPDRFKDIPAVGEIWKKNGVLNWNSYAIMMQSEEMGRQARRVLRENPRLLVWKALRDYWNFARFSLRHPYEGYYGLDGEETDRLRRAWMGFYERFLLLDFRTARELGAALPDDPLVKSLSPFYLGFPAIILIALLRIAVTWRRDPLRARTAAFMLLSILWVLTMVLFVDGMEGNRMRFSTEPFLFILLFWMLPWREAGREPLSRPVATPPGM